MYKNQRKYTRKPNGRTEHARPTRNGGYSSNRFRTARKIKKLDSALFVKKAKEVNASTAYAPKLSFNDFAIDEKLKRNIAEHGYTTPTEIQEKTIPSILEGRDVIGVANTGTGKTAAFLLPLVNKANLDRNERILIVTPTRELAMQILDELQVFKKGMDLDAVLCIGGANMDRQEKKLRHNPHFVIGTPGRLRDLIERKKLQLSMFRNIVLDEVDRMVDIGFINEVKFFISLLPQKRQSLFFSATVSGKVAEILNSFVKDPITVNVVKQATTDNVDQDIVRVNGANQKPEILHDLLIKEGFDKVIIFGRTKWGIEKLTNILLDKGFKAAAIHGNKSQGQRQRALDQFKQDRINILLATDVASRGIDIDNVTHVINYDAPETYDDYVHRIGRTGRAGKKGIAITFVE